MSDISMAQLRRLDQAIETIIGAIESKDGTLPPKKRAIVRSAILIFSEKGFAATSTKEIAVHAQVAEATIFKHYVTKKGLLLALVTPIFVQIIVPAAHDSLSEVIARHGGSLEEIIIEIQTSRLAFMRTYFPLVRIVIQELPFQDELQALFQTQQHQAAGALKELIEQEIAAGRIVGQDAPTVMRHFLSLFMGYLLATTYINPEQPRDDAAEIRLMVSNLLRGMQPRTG